MLVNKTNKVDNNYVPDNLILTDSIYKNNIYLNDKCFEMFKKLQKDMKRLGYSIDIMSGYRSYKYQEKIYNKLVHDKGLSYASRTVATPGSSEHQTGLAIDICVYKKDKCYIEHDLIDMKEISYLHKNIHKYGFILRYPFGKEEITGYNYEPWHIRYVGDISKYLYKNNFTLEEYYQKKLVK